MIKIAIYIAIGFGIYYLYDTGGDFTGLINTAKAITNQAAQGLADITSDN